MFAWQAESFAAAGKTARGIALAAAASLVTLTLLYAGIPFFGPLNDLITALGGVLSAVLVWRFHPLLRLQQGSTAGLYLVFAWAGAAAVVINSILVAVGQLDWMIGGMYTALGYALLGIWLYPVSHLLETQSEGISGVARLGKVAAFSMLLGLPGGPVLFLASGSVNIILSSVLFAGMLAGWLLYAVWCWRLSRMRFLVEDKPAGKTIDTKVERRK